VKIGSHKRPHLIQFIVNGYIKKSIRDKKYIRGCMGLAEGQEWKMIASEDKVSFMGDKNILKLDSQDSGPTLL
jgi:hypothetical protein